MQYLDSPWSVNTKSSRRPTPLTYEHLRQYTELELRFSKISSQTKLIDIQDILNEQSSLYVSTEIRYVIAQLLGLYQDKFETIRSEILGAINVYIKDIDAAAALEVTIPTRTESIGTVQIEGPAQTMEYVAINTAAPGPTALIAAASGLKHHITMIVLTVAGDTSITFSTASTPMTGAMAFGGTDEPRGMVANHGNFPLVGGTNQAFNITNSGSVLITGYLVYYDAA